MPRAVCRRVAARRRLGRLSQRHAAQGNSSRHEVGHAGGRDDLGGAAGRMRYDSADARVVRAALQASRGRTPSCARARNFHQGFKNGSALRPDQRRASRRSPAAPASASSTNSGGEPGYERMEKAGWEPKETPRAKIDNVLTFDKLTDVYNSGTMHEENQPCHLLVADTNICRDRCTVEYGNPCQILLSGRRLRAALREERRRRSKGGCRSTSPTACTARPATSPIRIKSSPGFRRRAARVPSTPGCER